MRPIALGTNAYTAFKCGDEQILAVLQHAPSIIVCVTVLGELLGGFAAGQRESNSRSELTQFLSTPRVKVVFSTTVTADLYALVYAALRRKGQPIPTNNSPDCHSYPRMLVSGAGMTQRLQQTE